MKIEHSTKIHSHKEHGLHTHGHDECKEACCCGHHHGDEDEEEEEHSLKKIIIAFIIFALALVVEHFGHKIPGLATLNPLYTQGLYLALYFASYMLVGFSILREVVGLVAKGRIFTEEFLMALATIVAIIIGEYSEAVAVMLFFQLGEYLEDKAVDSSRKSIRTLMNVCPDKATVLRNGKEYTVEAKDVLVGERIIVKPGERIPLDGTVAKGTSFADTSALTGESIPREVLEESVVLAGFINTESVLEITVTKPFAESSANRMLHLIEESQKRKASSEKFVARFAKVYTPVVCLAALLLAIIPPCLMLLRGPISSNVWHTWIYRALELLVVSCPCALVISVPLTFFAGLGLASKSGIMIKGSQFIEMLSRVKTVIFDKTGTLTKGVFELTAVHPTGGISENELVALATHAEYYSTHPISRSLKNAHQCPLCGSEIISDMHEMRGYGLKCMVQGKRVIVGSLSLMQKEGISGVSPCPTDTGTIIHVAVEGEYKGHIVINDVAKADSVGLAKKLSKAGVTKTAIFTGDNRTAAESMAQSFGISAVYADLLPENKVSELEKILSQANGAVAFVGDGINDAPVLTRSDVGIAMGALGSDAAVEAADVVIMDDSPSKVALALTMAKKTMCTVWQNVWFSLSIKTLIMVLCATGIARMWLAVFGDVGVTMLAVLNAMRLLWKKKRS